MVCECLPRQAISQLYFKYKDFIKQGKNCSRHTNLKMSNWSQRQPIPGEGEVQGGKAAHTTFINMFTLQENSKPTSEQSQACVSSLHSPQPRESVEAQALLCSRRPLQACLQRAGAPPLPGRAGSGSRRSRLAVLWGRRHWYMLDC